MEQNKLIAIIVVIAVIAAAAVGAVFLLKGDKSDGETSYTLKYVTNGGDAIDDKTFTKNTDTFDLSTPVRSGSYTFLGWYENADFSGSPVSQVAKGTEKDITVYAKWQLVLAPNATPTSVDQISNVSDVLVTFNDDATDKTILNEVVSAITAGKTLTVVNKDATGKETLSWTFNGAATTQKGYDPAEAMDTTVTPKTDDLETEKKIVLDFKYGGTLPYESTIKYFIGTDVFPAGTLISVQNEKDSEPIGQFPVDADGYVTFTIDHCSNWVLTKYITFTFNAGEGASFDGSATFTLGGDYGSAVNVTLVPAPTKTGYLFNNDQPWSPAVPATFTDEDATSFTAQFNPIHYTVKYFKNAEDATGTVDDQSLTYDALAVLSSGASLGRTGYTLTGWNTSADGSGTAYDLSGNVKNLATTDGATVNMYAMWAPIHYTVKYFKNAEDATGTVDDQSLTYDTLAALSSGPSLSRTGYILTGWNTAADGSGQPYNLNGNVKNLATTDGAIVNMYATWVPISYTAIFHSNGGSEITSVSYSIESAATPLTSPVRGGYAFQGWFDNEGLTGTAWTEIPAGTVGNKDFYAKWGSNNVTVQTKLDGTLHTFPEAITLWNNTNSVTMPATSAGVFYVETSANFPISNGDILTVKRGDAEIGTVGINAGRGELTVNFYSVTFDYAGGTFEDATSKVIDRISGGTLGTLPTPTRNGYDPNGWNTAITAETPVTAAVTYTAQWTAKTYNVTLNANGGTINSGNVTSYTYGVATNLPTDVTKTGSTFAGWYADSQFSGDPVTVIAAGEYGDKEYFAKWTVNKYTATVFFDRGWPLNYQILDGQNGAWLWDANARTTTKDFDYGTEVGAIMDDLFQEGVQFHEQRPTRTGYSYTGYTPDSGTIGVDGITITIQWTPNTTTVTFDSAGGSAVQGVTATYDSNAPTITPPTKADGAFLGFFLGDDMYYNPDGSSAKLWDIYHATATLTAHWGPYNIVANITLDGSAYEDLTVTAKKNDAGNAFALEYEGNGAYACRSGIEKNSDYALYVGNDRVGTIATSAQGSGSLNVAYFTVTFDLNGGTGNAPAAVVLSGNTVTEPQNISKTGNELTEWKNGEIAWDFSTSTVTAAVTLVAQWTPQSYSVTLNTNGGTINSGNVTSYTYGNAKSLPTDVTKTGSTFAGWYADSQFSGEPVTVIAAGEYGDKEYFAKWTVNKYTATVSFDRGWPLNYQILDGQNGAWLWDANARTTTKDFEYGTSVAAIMADLLQEGVQFHEQRPTRTGYNYAGYTPDSGTIGVDGVIIIIQWTAKTTEVTFDSAGGSPVEGVTATFDSGMPAITPPTKADGAFLGFFLGDDMYYNPDGTSAKVWDVYTATATLTAHWDNNSITVTFKVDGVGPAFQDQTISVWKNDAHADMFVRNDGSFYLETSENFPIVDGAYIIKRNSETAGEVTVTGGLGTIEINYRSVHFYVDTQSYGDVGLVVHGGTATAPAVAPQKDGYAFASWQTGNGENYDFSEPVITTLYLHAAFNPNQYTVRLYDGNDLIGSFQILYHREIETLSANLIPSKTGFGFLGYYLGDEKYYDSLGRAVKLSWDILQDTSLRAEWEANTVTVSFGDGVPALNATYGQAMPALGRDYEPSGEYGKRFIGYYDALEGGKKYYNADLTSAVQASDLTVDTRMYQRYEPITYSVVYNMKGGEGNMPGDQTVSIDGSFDEPATEPTKRGYTFGGWSFYENIMVEAFEDGVCSPETYYLQPEGTTLTLYAQWNPKSYTIHFDANGGSGDAPADGHARAGANFLAPEFATSKVVQGQRMFFGGWNTASDGTGTDYRGTVIFDDALVNLAGDGDSVTLYVKWAAMEFTPSVGYTFTGQKIDGPSEVFDVTMTVIAVGDTTFRVEQNTNYNSWTETWVTELPIGAYPIMNGWSPEMIEAIETGEHSTGTFTINGVEKVVDIYTQSYVVSGTNYTFTIYVTADGFVCYASETGPSGDVSEYQFTAHQQRQLQPAEITYRPNGGTPDENVVRTSSTYPALGEIGFTRDGYMFTGWSTNDLELFKPGDAVTQSRIVNANWERITNPKTNIEWTIYNLPEGIALMNGDNDALRVNGAEGQVITVTGGSSWQYFANGDYYTFTANAQNYRLILDDNTTLRVNAVNDNGRMTIVFGEAGDNDQYSRAYYIGLKFYQVLPEFAQYSATVGDAFVYDDGEEEVTFTVTQVSNSNYMFSYSGGYSDMPRAAGLYPQVFDVLYPDEPDWSVWTRGNVQFGGQNIPVYIITAHKLEQNYYSSYNQTMVDYNLWQLYIGVSDGLCYKAVLGDVDDAATGTVDYKTVTLVSKPADMHVVTNYEVTMDCNGGDYQGSSVLTRTLSAPSNSIIPERDEYVFVGWSLTLDGQVAYAYSNGAFTPAAFNPAHAQSGAISLFAVWEDAPAAVYDIVCSGDSRYTTTFSEDQQTVTLPTLDQLGCQDKPMTRLSFYSYQGSSYNYAPGETIATSIALSCLDEYERLNIYVSSPYIDVYVDANHQGGDTSRVIRSVDSGLSIRLPSYNDLEDLTTWSGHTATGYATSAQGQTAYDFDSYITPAQIAQIYDAENGRITLFLTWTEGEPVIGYLYGNFEGANPEYVSNIIPDEGTELPDDAGHLPWNRGQSWTATGFNTQADGNGTTYAFGALITAEAVAALENHALYVIWEAATITQCRIYGNYENCDPLYFTVNVDPESGMIAPSFASIDARYFRNDATPIGLADTPREDAVVGVYFGAEMSYDDVLACNGILYVIWAPLPPVPSSDSDPIYLVILSNYDCQEAISLTTLADLKSVQLPSAEEITELWNRGALVTPVCFSTTRDGNGGVTFDLGSVMNQGDAMSLPRAALYVLWNENTIQGRIYGNFEGATPEYQQGPIQGETTLLPDRGEIEDWWTWTGHTPVGFNTQADGSGDFYPLRAEVSTEALLSLENPYLYVQWEEGETPEVVSYTVIYLMENGNEACSRNFFSTDRTYTILSANDFAGMGISADGVYDELGNNYELGRAYDTSVFIALANDNHVLNLHVSENGGEIGDTTYTGILYANNGTEGSDTHQFTANDGHVELPDREDISEWTRSGFVAVGFNSRSDSTGTFFHFGQNVSVSDLIALADGNNTVSLYVDWENTQTVYTGIIRANNNTDQNVSMYLVERMEAITLPEEIGWTYAGHYAICFNTQADGAGTDYFFGDTIYIDDLIDMAVDRVATLYVEWGEEDDGNTYDLIIYPCTGNQADEPLETSFNADDEHYRLPENIQWTSSNPNHIFIGFNSTADYAGTFFFAGEEVPVENLVALASNNTVTLFVDWANLQDLYTGIIHANNGSQDTIETVISSHMGSIRMPNDVEWEYDGHVATGFNTEDNGNGDGIEFGQSVSVADIIAYANEDREIHLYVQWEEGEAPEVVNYTVIYLMENGNEACSRNFFSTDRTYTILSAEELEGMGLAADCVYDDWDNEYGLGQAYETADLIELADDERVIYLYLIEGNQQTPIIHLDVNGAIGELDDVYEVEYYDDEDGYAMYVLPSAEEIDSAGIENDGYMMSGWATTADGSAGPEDLMVYSMGDTTYLLVYDSFDGDEVTVYLVWEEIGDIYTVRFNINNGVGVTPRDVEVMEGRRFFLPAPTSVPAGSAFAGWNTQADGEGTHCRLSTVLDDDLVALASEGVVTLYAEWITPTAYTATVGDRFIAEEEQYEGENLVSQSQTISVVVYADQEIYRLERFTWDEEKERWTHEFDSKIYLQGSLPNSELEIQGASLYAEGIFGIEGNELGVELLINDEPRETAMIPYVWSQSFPGYTATLTVYVDTEDQCGYIVLVTGMEDGVEVIEKDSMTEMHIGEGNGYTPGDYTVTYRAGPGSETTVVREHQSVLAGIDEFDFEAPEGLVFAGWSDSDSNVTVPAGSIVVRMDHEVHAVWAKVLESDPDNAMVIIDGNGGSSAGSTTAVSIIEDGSELSIDMNDYAFVRNEQEAVSYQLEHYHCDRVTFEADSDIDIWALLLDGYEIYGNGDSVCYYKNMYDEGEYLRIVIPVGNIVTVYMDYPWT
ncbi:MAG: hypothetical protein E7Z63_00405 [Thermoplasmata archaeon]|nr:hypothetical protein [Thermoplasmata archaeon]